MFVDISAKVFSPSYWANRILFVVQKINNICRWSTISDLGMRQNPEAAMGIWSTSTIDGAGGQDFGGNCSSDNEVEHSDSNMDFPAHGDFDDLPSVCYESAHAVFSA